MISLALHAGIGHPSLLWIVVAGVVGFVAGTVVVAHSRTTDRTETTPVEE